MSNEEKILAMLEALTEKVEQQGEQLAQVMEKLDVLDERSLRTALMQENQVIPQLQLLYEGHGAIMDQLNAMPTAERVEALESDMSVVKDVVRHLRQDVNDLKKAQ